MQKNWIILSILIVGLLLLILSYIPLEKQEEDLKFHRFPVFEEEGYIVKPNN